VDDETVDLRLVDLHAERSDSLDGRLRVSRAAEADDSGLSFADGADENGSVGDRLVSGDGDMSLESGHGLDTHRPDESSEGFGARLERH